MPSGAAEIAGALHEVAPRTWIVPGLSDPRGDVMRGEEVQLLGAVSAGLAPADALLCQPGTHCKWARMRDGAVAAFSTSMTGEMFALLKQHSLLAEFLGGPVADGPALPAGLPPVPIPPCSPRCSGCALPRCSACARWKTAPPMPLAC
jgi:2-dehydro-3-deoxygalactonokinase